MFIAVTLLRRRMMKAIGAKTKAVTMEQLGVLEVLMMNGPLNMSEISNGLYKENANITRIIDKLEKNGFVERKKSPTDRRAILIHLTPAGEAIFKELIPVLINELKSATSTITEEEQKELLRIVRKIIAENSSV